ncbi:MAG: hypothetical protein KKD66_22750 [Proteobacteria bacterium]|nr:hypothetical protein [Pseudomonadota bacterium]
MHGFEIELMDCPLNLVTRLEEDKQETIQIAENFDLKKLKDSSVSYKMGVFKTEFGGFIVETTDTKNFSFFKNSPTGLNRKSWRLYTLEYVSTPYYITGDGESNFEESIKKFAVALAEMKKAKKNNQTCLMSLQGPLIKLKWKINTSKIKGVKIKFPMSPSKIKFDIQYTTAVWLRCLPLLFSYLWHQEYLNFQEFALKNIENKFNVFKKLTHWGGQDLSVNEALIWYAKSINKKEFNIDKALKCDVLGYLMLVKYYIICQRSPSKISQSAKSKWKIWLRSSFADCKKGTVDIWLKTIKLDNLIALLDEKKNAGSDCFTYTFNKDKTGVMSVKDFIQSVTGKPRDNSHLNLYIDTFKEVPPGKVLEKNKELGVVVEIRNWCEKPQMLLTDDFTTNKVFEKTNKRLSEIATISKQLSNPELNEFIKQGKMTVNPFGEVNLSRKVKKRPINTTSELNKLFGNIKQPIHIKKGIGDTIKKKKKKIQ